MEILGPSVYAIRRRLQKNRAYYAAITTANNNSTVRLFFLVCCVCCNCFVFPLFFLWFVFHNHLECFLPVSFELCDANGSGKIDQDDMEQVLTSINDTASYFGDPVLKRAQIKVGRERGGETERGVGRGIQGMNVPYWLVVHRSPLIGGQRHLTVVLCSLCIPRYSFRAITPVRYFPCFPFRAKVSAR